ncbi:hypothetical protein BS17DRAFT_793621 [Gyrodon lividus]|nr:hypothetical protein BS17DRAFT_793621 [Gyrodon lividus]
MGRFHLIKILISQLQSFCDHENIPLQLCIPASKHLLCAFAASRVGALAGNTVQTHLTAIKAWHIYNKKPWHGGPCLCYPPHPPITCSMLLLLANSLSITDSFDACCLAAACFAISFKPAFVVCRFHLLPPFNQNGSRKCHLPFTKLGPSDPIATINNHLNINKIPPNLSLFSYLSTRGWHCLTKKKLLARCNSIWLPARIPAITGHSFCIGGTTKLLLTRVPPDVVKALGHWSSDAFLCY